MAAGKKTNPRRKKSKKPEGRRYRLNKIFSAKMDARFCVGKNHDEVFDILTQFFTDITEQAAQQIGIKDSQYSPRDRIFDFIMLHADHWQQQRADLKKIVADKIFTPMLLRIFLKLSPRWMASLSLGELLPGRAFMRVGLVGLYGYAIWVWSDDDSGDMAKTMAALDRILLSAETILSGIISLKEKIDPHSRV